MNSSNPIKFGMFAMMNDRPNVMCKLWSDDMSLKLDIRQVYLKAQTSLTTFLIGHVYYECRLGFDIKSCQF